MANNHLPLYVNEAIEKLSSFCKENQENHLEDFDVEITKGYVEKEERLTIDITFNK